MLFAWDELNVEHLSKHGVSPEEAEFAVGHADAPRPEQNGEDKFAVWGTTESGRLLHFIFVLKAPEVIEFDALTISECADLDEHD